MRAKPQQARFVCVDNGHEVDLAFAETHRRIWGANLAYLVLPGWYRYQLNGKTRTFFLAEIRIVRGDLGGKVERLCRGDLQLLRELHNRRLTPVTVPDLDPENVRAEPLSRGAFVKRKERLNYIFPDGVIVRAFPPDGHGGNDLGYHFHWSLSRFMVIRAAGCGVADDVWQELISPPTASAQCGR